MIDLTIVIPHYETPSLLADCLEAIDQAGRQHPALSFETIVVDNGSRDGFGARESDLVDRDSDNDRDPASGGPVRAGSRRSFRLISLVRNRGFAVAVNHGLRARRGRHVLLLNSDVEVDAGLLSRAVQILDESADVAVLGVGLFHPDGRPQRSVHPIPRLATELVPEPLRQWSSPMRVPDAAIAQGRRGRPPKNDAPIDVEAIRGAAFFIRGEVVEKVGLFDEGYFFFLEETDYCWRVRRAGHRILYCPTLRATHRLGASSKRRVPLATRIEFHRSLYRFLEMRSGAGVSRVSRIVRTLRTAISLPLLGVAAIFSPAGRSRLSQRWGLLLWHLRGRPSGDGLAGALLADLPASVPKARHRPSPPKRPEETGNECRPDPDMIP